MRTGYLFRSFRSFRSSAAALFLLVPPCASATEAPEAFWDFMSEEASNLTVASPIPETVFDSVSNVAVIDRSAIERYNFASVSDALRTLPGISVTRTYLMHGLPTIRGALQEHYANKVLVMINNVPMWNAVTGEGDLDRVDINAVERIEVLRGPASVLYGSNALTGAVNIVLRETPAPSAGGFWGGLGTAAGGYGGKLSLSRSGGFYSGKRGNDSFTVTAGARSEEQPRVLFTDEDRNVVLSREYIRPRGLSLAARRGRTSLLFNAAASEQNYLGNSLDLASGGLFSETKEMAAAAASHELAPSWGSLKLSALYDWQRRNIPRDDSGDLRSEIAGSRLNASAVAVARLGGNVHLEAGAAREYREAMRYLNYYSKTGTGESDNGLAGRSSAETSAHLQAGYENGPWRLLAGGRYTRDSRSWNNISARASAVYGFDERKSLKLLFSQSFRAPTPFEQYFEPSTVTVLGNPLLEPERTETWELVYLVSRESSFAHFTVYSVKYRDTIFRDLGDFTRDGVTYTNVNHYENAPSYGAEGLEIHLRHTGRRLHYFLSLDISRGDHGDERAVPAPGAFGLAGGTSWNYKFVPQYSFSGGLYGERGRFSASCLLNSWGPTRSLRERVPAQFWADLNLGWRSGPGGRHTFAVRNITGKTVEVPEYVRLKVVERLPLYTGRTMEYTFNYRF